MTSPLHKSASALYDLAPARKAGRLIYIIGASGAGKDSVINEARRRLGWNSRLAFATRYITRPADYGGEAHIPLHPRDFVERAETGSFALHWESHGFLYGIGRDIELQMLAGFDVAVNGSREYLPAAASRYPTLVPVLVEVSPDVLRRRLLERGRESEQEVEARLARTRAQGGVAHPAMITIRNDGALQNTVDDFLAALGIHQLT